MQSAGIDTRRVSLYMNNIVRPNPVSNYMNFPLVRFSHLNVGRIVRKDNGKYRKETDECQKSESMTMNLVILKLLNDLKSQPPLLPTSLSLSLSLSLPLIFFP